MKIYDDSERNITCDNWYTSAILTEELLKKLTLVGTVIKSKKELPKEFIQ